MEMQLQTTDNNFGNSANFEHAQRVAKMLATSSLIPKEFQGNVQNTMIALEMANRIGASPLMVMQNLYVIQGKPSWSSSFIIAAINSCKRFSPIRFVMEGSGDEYGCHAWAYDLETKDKLEGPKITLKMANAEGWSTKAGSKWKTMPELMLRYRAAAFFGRLYAPDIMMGMHSQEEVIDIQPASTEDKKVDKEAERIQYLITDATSVQELKEIEAFVMPEQMDLFNQKMQEVANGVQ